MQLPPGPEGINVLVVDGDETYLDILKQMLKQCRYCVTPCTRAETALALLHKNRGWIDIVLCDACLPDMDSFMLVKNIGLEMDLPVILMSENDGEEVAMKGIMHGACDYHNKPASMEILKKIWLHVAKKKCSKQRESKISGCSEHNKQDTETNSVSSPNEGSSENRKSKQEGNEENEVEHKDSTAKKRRVVWTSELHKKFIDAVYKLGGHKAVPKKILEVMNIPDLTRENVASHLQKYRLHLVKKSAEQNQNGVDPSLPRTPKISAGSRHFDQQVFFSGRVSQSLASLRPGSTAVTNTSINHSVANQITAQVNSTDSLTQSTFMEPWQLMQAGIFQPHYPASEITQEFSRYLPGFPQQVYQPRRLRNEIRTSSMLCDRFEINCVTESVRRRLPFDHFSVLRQNGNQDLRTDVPDQHHQNKNQGWAPQNVVPHQSAQQPETTLNEADCSSMYSSRFQFWMSGSETSETGMCGPRE